MLNIAPHDYERYAALYGPPPPPQVSNAQAADSRRTIEASGPVRSELGRRGSAFSDKIKTPVSLHHKTRRATNGNGQEQPLTGTFSTNARAYFDLPDKFLNATQTQLGITPEKTAGLYEHRVGPRQGTLRIIA